MQRQNAIPYVSFYVDDAGNSARFAIDSHTRLVGWQCGFEPLFVAVRSYLPGCRVDDGEAAALATDLLTDRSWFSGDATGPDYIL